MSAALKLTYIDTSGESASVVYNGVTMTAANFDAQRALQDTLTTATTAITLGSAPYKKEIQALVVRGSRDLPADKDAQRETKWRVSYEDTTTYLRYSVDIPMADRSKLLANSDKADLAEEDMAAYVAAFEAYVKSPDANAVNILEITQTGRRT